MALVHRNVCLGCVCVCGWMDGWGMCGDTLRPPIAL